MEDMIDKLVASGVLLRSACVIAGATEEETAKAKKRRETARCKAKYARKPAVREWRCHECGVLLNVGGPCLGCEIERRKTQTREIMRR